MIEEVINAINKNISASGLFQDVFGLAEQVTQPLPFEGDNVSQTFPAIYKPSGELVQVFNPDKNRSVSWHTGAGNVGIALSENNTTACGDTFLFTYPLSVIGIVLRDKICPSTYTDFEVGMNLVSSLHTTHVGGKFQSVSIEAGSIIIDKNAIVRDNFANIDFAVDFEYSFVQVNYTVVIEADQKCVSTYCKK